MEKRGREIRRDLKEGEKWGMRKRQRKILAKHQTWEDNVCDSICQRKKKVFFFLFVLCRLICK